VAWSLTSDLRARRNGLSFVRICIEAQIELAYVPFW
jgi:hypothetical protein